MPDKLISQADLARMLQLSSATVSLALADNSRIPPETRTRVKILAKKLGYKPDIHAAHLAIKRWANKTPTSRANIAYMQCLMSKGNDDLYLPGLLKQADALGYNLDILHSWEFTSDDHLTKVLYSRGIQGVVVGQSGDRFHPRIPHLDEVAVVQCGLFLPVEILTLVRPDLDSAVRLCFEKVRSRGFERIGMVLLHNLNAESDRILEDAIWNLKRVYSENIEVFIEKWSVFLSRRTPLKEWFYRHQIDVVVGINPAIDDFLQQLGIDAPFACMIHDLYRPDFDGADLQCSLMGEMSINLLDTALRQNLFGIPSVKKVFMVEPTWHEGTTLLRPRVTPQ